MTAPNPPHSPRERPALRSLLPAPLLTAVLGALAVGGAVALAPESVRLPLAGGAGAAVLLLTVTVTAAVHARSSARLLRRRLDAVARDAGLLLQERARMTEEFGRERGRLTEEFVQERARIAAEYARERARMTAEFERERERLAEERSREAGEQAQATEEAEREKARLVERARQAEADRTAALAVTANVAGRMQALATGTLADLRAMEERHADEDVLADLLHIDHRTAQAGRLADSVAVLAGARSGRRWARPIPMESILRGAMGRIGAYRRVRLHSSSESAVAGHAAEGVMHALAELLDNAANFSPPTAEVHVYVEEVPAGVIVSVEDAGLVMSDVQLRRAERAVSGEGAADITGLSGTRLGLAVVGRLARKHGLKVSFRPSARGGTGVLMLIPQDILAGAVPGSGVPAGGVPAGTVDVDGVGRVTAAEEAVGATAAENGVGATAAEGLYGAARAPHDLDAGATGTSYAAARASHDPDTATSYAAARPDRDSRPVDDASSGAVRFSSFRRAVRGTSGLDQAFFQGTASGDDGSTSTGSTDFTGVEATTETAGTTGEIVREREAVTFTSTPTSASSSEEAVRQPALEPIREPEWGAVREARWEAEPVRGAEWEADPVREPEQEPGPVQETNWEPEPVRGTRWALDPVRELTWEPARETHPEPTDGTASTQATPSSYPSYTSYSSHSSPSVYPASSSAYSSYYAAYASYGNPEQASVPSPEVETDAGGGTDVGADAATDLPSGSALGLPSNAALGLPPSSASYPNPSDPALDQHTHTHPHLEGDTTP
ncbi:ATP-binding protein [Streptomyces ipomoeae]|uniref:ATP-binding protein n=1 Tax=Streptomyces ipomoeae TaxID=103232 RepID=UPI0029BCCD81|nr:ATP-binding protein [Streptomyces ipomoeae]MDX2696545.1 ATP-binding protein [Streptomyces ipomoeae]